ncbi:hypothetical protein [Nocardia xishanensis]|uniref:hypothetical protein n=1 Tax=Nocardia xishanensis TaxID=238964 RepID=UPI000B334E4E|nr:hypothetical protein [Nocardia xishanensis]
MFTGLTDDEYEQLATVLDKLIKARELTASGAPGLPHAGIELRNRTGSGFRR